MQTALEVEVSGGQDLWLGRGLAHDVAWIQAKSTHSEGHVDTEPDANLSSEISSLPSLLAFLSSIRISGRCLERRREAIPTMLSRFDKRALPWKRKSTGKAKRKMPKAKDASTTSLRG